MRILVCGGRDYHNFTLIYKTLDDLDSGSLIEVVIHGNASGADTCGSLWALLHHKQALPYPAKWDDLHVAGAIVRKGQYGLYNVVAGFQRNQQMIDEGKPDLVVAFPGGKGTADMVNRAHQAKIEVMEVKDETIDS